MTGPRPRNAELAKARITHGMTGTPIYKLWVSMKGRCENPQDHNYAKYGARGIAVCQRWSDSFEAFFADMGPRPADKSLDRYPDNDGNYEPGNCRWATGEEQGRNKRNNRRIEAFGEAKTIAEWADDPRCVVGADTLKTRYFRGWPVERCMSEPAAWRGQRNSTTTETA